MPNIFKAYNFDPKAKAEAEASAEWHALNCGGTWTVEYRDHYDDTRVAGDFIVRQI